MTEDSTLRSDLVHSGDRPLSDSFLKNVWSDPFSISIRVLGHCSHRSNMQMDQKCMFTGLEGFDLETGVKSRDSPICLDGMVFVRSIFGLCRYRRSHLSDCVYRQHVST